ncbi:MAG: ABC transporter substrate-binding protein, partial [Candidatus Cloacimonetes bacterium]|nr:ABC transporter substrate-binding protein [Candidatus Cloacimonadota bacterium]MDY0230792.1 ABC transporter substrate-binding protein [Candidatus Cloacimonadaceae bacterium]
MDIKKMVLPIVFAGVLVIGLSGCTPGVEEGGNSVIQLRAYKGGYDLDWLHKATEEFTKAHPNITFEFIEESGLVDSKALQEIALPQQNQTDLYFLTGIDIDLLMQRSYSALRTREQVLLEPLNDVYESKGIDINGEEESETIASRLFDGYKEASTYEGSFDKWKGSMFTLPWASAMTGLFVNQAVLDKFDIETPLTSDEFVAAIDKISSEGEEEDIFPFAWGGENTAGFWSFLFETWFGQYSGRTKFENFVNCEPEDGDIINNGYKVYEDPGILESLKAMFQILNLDYCANGSASRQHMEAQTDFIIGKSAFLTGGDWAFKEMSKYYYTQAVENEIEMIAVPMLSTIGTEIGITDAQLHTLVEMIDNHNTYVEIKTAIPSLTDANIDRVVNARSIYDSIGGSHEIVIPSYADAKDAAKLFIRFFYSNDGCRIFRNNAY